MLAICTICNSLSIIIERIEEFPSTVYWRYSDEEKIRKSKLKETWDGDGKFRVGKQWYDLSEFCRVDL